jgi:hypothetical protein
MSRTQLQTRKERPGSGKKDHQVVVKKRLSLMRESAGVMEKWSDGVL